MSTRYVWDKCKIAYTIPVEESYAEYEDLYCSGTVYLSTAITKNSDGTVNLSGTIISGQRYDRVHTVVPTVDSQSASTYRYLATKDKNNKVYIESGGTGYWKISTTDPYYYIRVAINDDPTYAGAKHYFTVHTLGPSQGDVVESVSSGSSSAYPSNGVSGYNWYEFKGSDSIDPLSVTYDTDRPERGKAVKVIAHPAAGSLRWNETTLPKEVSLGKLVYGDGKFVAPGDFYDADETGIGELKYIIERSTDGINWTMQSAPGYIRFFAYGNGKFVGMSQYYTIIHSADGINWTEKELQIDGIDGDVTWQSITYGDGKFVIISDRNSHLSAYSTDGINWTMGGSVGIGGSSMTLSYGGGTFVAVGGGIVYCSTDGTNWSYKLTAYTLSTPVYADGRFVAVSDDGDVYQSFDGMSWSVISKIPGDVARPIHIAYGGGTFVVLADRGDTPPNPNFHSWYSTDGINWVESSIPPSVSWIRAVYGNGKFVSVAGYIYADNAARSHNKAMYTTIGLGGTTSYQYQYSTDGGKTWTNAGTPTTDTEKDIAVPDKAEWFMARVRAQDDMGFVSNDYVSGPNLAVQTVRAWVGVDGAARRIKRVWIGVDGKAKEVTNGWVGDENGKARRFF